MNCKKWRQLISSAHDGQLNSIDTFRLQDHLTTCSDCQQAWQWQQLVGKTMSGLPLSEAPSDFNQAIWDKIDAVPAAGVSIQWKRWSLPFGALAVTAAAAALVMLSYQPLQIDKQPQLDTARVESLKQPQQQLTKEAIPKAMVLITEETEKVAAQEPVSSDKQVIVKEKVVKTLSESEQNVQASPVVDKTKPRRPKVVKHYRGPRRIPGKALTTSKPGKVEDTTVVSAAAAGTQPDTSQQVLELEPRDMRIMNNKIHINRNEQTRLEFQLDQAGLVHIKIFSRTGRLVKTLQEGELSAGSHSFSWDGRTQTGEVVASGIYVMMISGDLKMQKFKIAVIK